MVLIVDDEDWHHEEMAIVHRDGSWTLVTPLLLSSRWGLASCGSRLSTAPGNFTSSTILPASVSATSRPDVEVTWSEKLSGIGCGRSTQFRRTPEAWSLGGYTGALKERYDDCPYSSALPFQEHYSVSVHLPSLFSTTGALKQRKCDWLKKNAWRRRWAPKKPSKKLKGIIK